MVFLVICIANQNPIETADTVIVTNDGIVSVRQAGLVFHPKTNPVIIGRYVEDGP